MGRSGTTPPRIKYRCYGKCKRETLVPPDFYPTISTICENDGFIPVCKDCLSDLYTDFLYKYNDIYKAIRRVCMMYDIYYSDKIVEACLKKETYPSFASYMKRAESAPYNKKTFENTLMEGFIFDKRINDIINAEASVEDVERPSAMPRSVRERWGSGFSDSEYKIMEEHYKSLKESNPNCDNNQEIFIMNLCQIKMQQDLSMRTGRIDDYVKLTDLYRKTFTQAGLKTAADIGESAEETWGSWAAIISKYTPEEYYKDKQLYKDFDGLGEFIERHMLRPLKNLMFGSTDRDYEFNVEDGDEP